LGVNGRGPISLVEASASASVHGTVRAMWLRTSELEGRINEIMDRIADAGDDHRRRAAALEDYLRLARTHEGEGEQVDIAPWSEDLADCYVALGWVDEAVRTIRNVPRGGDSEDAERLCDLAEKLMRRGLEPQARSLWEQARADFPGDVWVYVQAGIAYADIADHVTALAWVTAGTELALRTGDPEATLEQLVPLRASCLSAVGDEPDTVQARAELAETRGCQPPVGRGPCRGRRSTPAQRSEIRYATISLQKIYARRRSMRTRPRISALVTPDHQLRPSPALWPGPASTSRRREQVRRTVDRRVLLFTEEEGTMLPRDRCEALLSQGFR
jgi:tetratricopeptide (TPR) repeat protein